MSDTYATRLQAAQQERRAALLALAADRPSHLAFLRALLAEADPVARFDLPAPRGVSARVAEALLDDVDWIMAPAPERGFLYSYPGSYAARRRTDARATDARSRTADSLESRFRL